MKFLKQFGIILAVSLAGEALSKLIPLPIPGSIYGLILMFALLFTRVIRLSQVSETANFLIEIMPLLFIPAAVGMMNSWKILEPVILPFAVIIVVSTFLVMIVTGHTTQWMLRRERKER